MEIREERVDSVTVLWPNGRMDARGARDLEARAAGLISEGARQLLLNLEQLERIDSSGMRALLGLARKLEALDGMLVLCSLGEAVQEAFDVAGFDFVTTPGPEPALALLRQAAPTSRVSGIASRLLGVAFKRNARARRDDVPGAAALASVALELLKRPRPR